MSGEPRSVLVTGASSGIGRATVERSTSPAADQIDAAVEAIAELTGTRLG